MNSLSKLKLLVILSVALLGLAGCSLGYDSEGPYPYSHVNKPPATTYQSSAQTTKEKQTGPAIRNKPTPPRTVKVASRPVKGTSKVTIGRGDTVYAISRRYGVTVREVITSNNLRPPYLLKPGQSLNIPQGSSYTVKRGDTVYGVSRANGIMMNDLVRINGLKRPYALAVGQTLKVPGRSEARATQVAIAPPPQITGKGFMWPVRGSVISGYGPKQAGYHNDGVNIRAPHGATVHASESGVVVHASNKLQGYGNLILIKHQNGWVTAYAHNDKILVSKGQQVVRGQVVAEVGSTGRVDSPQLHFEMRKGSRAVNPTLYLKS
tara:strand:- start:16970 stop:17932 length:963 start_codon:yes stop_codon:yes gene_type:complete